MSGIEIAGLVLSAMPLIISSLVSYRRGLDQMADWASFRPCFRQLVHDIQLQSTHFKQTVETMLLKIGIEDEKIALLLVGQKWDDAHLVDKLRKYMPDSSEMILIAIERVYGSINDLCEDLGIAKGQVSCHSSSYSTEH
jgi:hypothetical protein